MKQLFTDIAQFDSASAQNSSEAYHTNPNAFKFGAGTHLNTDMTRSHNEAYTFYLRFNAADTGAFKAVVGGNASGVGIAVQLDFTSTNKWIRIINSSGLDTSIGSVIAEVDIQNQIILNDSAFVKCTIIVSQNKLEFYYGNRRIHSITNYTANGNNFALVSLTGSSQTYVSDLIHYGDQVLHGNVNLNGAPNDGGEVVLYNQSTMEFIKKISCDPNGEYMLFIEDDPLYLNKYFIYGYIKGIGIVQPRGVSNITIS